MLNLRLEVRPLLHFAAVASLLLCVVASGATAAALAPAIGYMGFFAFLTIYFGSLTSLTVGADGVLMHRRFKARFLPFASIASAYEDANWLNLLLRDGEVVRLYTSRGSAKRADYVKECDELVAAIVRGVALAAEGSHRPYVRIPDALVEAAEAPYREAPSPDTRALLGVVHDDQEPANRRAETALLLAVVRDEEIDVRGSLEQASRRVVNPGLRKVLTATARGDVKTAQRAYVTLTSRR